MGKLTVGIVTLPFRDEGKEFVKRAIKGIRELKKHVDSLLIIDNQKLYQVFGDLNIYDAFPKADEVLSNAVKSIAEIITRPGFINVDFADVKMVMKNSGMAIMGTGTASGPDRAAKAVEMAFESPLLNDCDLNTAKGVLVNITSSKKQGPTMSELAQIMEYVNNFTGNASAFKRGVVIDENMGEKISVTVVATGFNVSNLPQIGLDDDTEGGRIILGESGIYASEDIPASTSRIIIDDLQEEEQVHQVAEQSVVPQEKATATVASQPYVKYKGKPALVLEPNDDIVKLESVPAYVRRNQKLHEQIMQNQQESGDMKIDQINGSHHLTSNNSYLHQTQD
jgi:cell division protein FtsZ